jgi:diguanylate cyclase (GGDEF)-like protein
LAAIIHQRDPELICTDAAGLERLLAQRGPRDVVEPLGLIVVQDSATALETVEPVAYEYRPGNLTRLRLPAEVPASVLRLACQLLVDAVRLRRQMQHAGRTQQSLARQALADPLTELSNRRSWDEELVRRVSAADAAGTSLTLAIFDLDCFKAVNDERGHDVGDATLRLAAKTLREQLRERDFLARIGGDEFGLLISGVDLDTSQRIVERIRSSLSRLQPNDECPAPAASAGVAVRPSRSDLSGRQLFQLADQALLEAKRAGRGRTIAAGRQSV